MHASGIGKAMLAYMPRAAVVKLTETNGLPEFTPKTLTFPDMLYSDLEAIAGRGLAFGASNGG